MHLRIQSFPVKVSTISQDHMGRFLRFDIRIERAIHVSIFTVKRRLYIQSSRETKSLISPLAQWFVHDLPPRRHIPFLIPAPVGSSRSEERRVGKGGRSGWCWCRDEI